MTTKVMLSGLLVAVGFVSAEAMAFRKYFEQFSEHYQANQISTQLLTSEQACGVCHVRASGGGQRTPYGPSVACSQLNLQAFGFTFENTGAQLMLSNVVGETRLQISGEAGAILARCDSEKLAGSLLR